LAATHGHVWSDFEFAENHSKLDINALHRAGALIEGAQTTWVWENGRKASLGASLGVIFLSGDREQTIRFEWLPFLNERFVRPRFLCPGCGCGSYHLHEKAGVFACRRCCHYDYRSRHRQRFSPAFRHIAMLRKKLGADPRPLSPIPPRESWRRVYYWRRVSYDRLVAALARAEAAAYGDLGRLLGYLETRTGSHE
jgi:hypothetical protein